LNRTWRNPALASACAAIALLLGTVTGVAALESATRHRAPLLASTSASALAETTALASTQDPPTNHSLRAGRLTSTNQITASSEVTSTQAITSSQAITATGLITSTGLVTTEVSIAATSPLGMMLPDSELVYGPTLYGFDTAEFVAAKGGYLASYSELVGGQPLTAAEIIDQIALEYSVGPRVLLALIQMQSGWVTNASPKDTSTPLGSGQPGLYGALAATADSLNAAYYAHRHGDASILVLSDGSAIEIPDVNAATFALLAHLTTNETGETWAGLQAPTLFYVAWTSLFGDPYDFNTAQPLPEEIPQIELELPFASGSVWFFIAGPHSPIGEGAARAAIDLAPPPADQTGCYPSTEPVLAAAKGKVLLSSASGVLVDLDGDGFAGTGWANVYGNLSSAQRVAAGEKVEAGQHLGFPSCEGGVPTQSRVVFSRRYNGEWIPADFASAPMVLGGWSVVAGEDPYEGWMIHLDFDPRQAMPEKDPTRNGIAAIPSAN